MGVVVYDRVRGEEVVARVEVKVVVVDDDDLIHLASVRIAGNVGKLIKINLTFLLCYNTLILLSFTYSFIYSSLDIVYNLY